VRTCVKQHLLAFSCSPPFPQKTKKGVSSLSVHAARFHGEFHSELAPLNLFTSPLIPRECADVSIDDHHNSYFSSFSLTGLRSLFFIAVLSPMELQHHASSPSIKELFFC
jgi:hypothetical protein